MKKIYIIAWMFMLCLASREGYAQHGWTVNPADYSYNGTVTAVVFLGSTEVSTGTLGAFVDETCRGYVEGMLFDPTGRTVFVLTCYSNQTTGETLNFKYYDPGENKIYEIEETLEFTSDMIVGNAEEPLEFHSITNYPPVVDDIPDQSVLEGAAFATVYLDDYVTDPDHTDEEITWTHSGNIQLTVSIVNRVAAVGIPDGDWNGSETITFTATDPSSASDSDAATFSVTAVNDPPVFTIGSDQTVAEDAGIQTVAGWATGIDDGDPEVSQTLSFVVSNDNTGLFSTQPSVSPDGTLSYTPAMDAWGSATVTVILEDDGGTANGGSDTSDPQTFTITVTAVNDAPVTGNIPDQTVTEGENFTTILLDDYVTDVDNADEEITWSYSGNTDLSVSIVNRVATVTVPDENWNGSKAITFTATDPGGLTDSDVATFTVTAENDPPVVSGIPDQTIAEGGSFATIQLDNYVADVDNTDSQMTWTYSGNTDLTVNIVNRVATIGIPDIYWNGSETITFTATDPGGLSDSDAATFTVSSENDPPVVSDIPDQAIEEGENFSTISLDEFVADPDHEDSEITWTYSGNVQLTVSIVNRVATVGIPDENWNGAETITFTATDPGNLSNSDAAVFSVAAVNDAPVVEDIPDQTVQEGQTFALIVLDDYVSDADHSDSQIAWVYSGNSELTVDIINRVANIGIPDENWFGSETITFTATDPGELSDSDAVVFSVTAVNDAPVVSGIHDQTIAEGESFATVLLDEYVTDVDHTDNEMTWSNSGNTDLTVSIVNRVATVSVPDENWYGSETITFTATDPGGLSDSDAAAFTVTSVNDIPKAENVSISGTLKVGNVLTGSYTYSDVEGDPEGASVYSWYRSDNASGLNETQISGAGSQQYTLLPSEEGKYIRFAVIPVAQTGASPGVITYSSYEGSVQAAAPTAVISGDYTICDDGSSVNLMITLTGNAPWEVVYQRNGTDDVTISDISESPYLLAVTEEGTYTLVSVSDKYYASGSTSGSAVVSYFPTPTASISGSNTICPDGTKTPITVTLTGAPPWTFSYRRDVASPVTVQNVMNSPYVFEVSNTGTYSLVSVADANCTGTVSGEAIITYYDEPTAVITGSASICDDGSSTPLQIDLTGAPPWVVTYQRGTQNPITVSNITETPYIFYVNQAGQYKLVSVEDSHCSGTVSGTATIYLLPLPTATLSGDVTICPGTSTSLRVDLTGVPPWSITYLRNGANPTSIGSISSSPYYIDVSSEATYTLQSVNDNNCSGTVAGTATVSHLPVPKATILGAYEICDGETADINLVLEGTAPWRVVVYRNGALYRVIDNIMVTTPTITVNEAGIFTIEEVTDLNCTGTTSGSATVTVHPLPEVEITGLATVYNVEDDPVLLTGSPSGGVFSGPGVVSSSGYYFYPDLAGISVEPHPIVYEYTSAYGCTNTDTVLVTVTDADGDIVFDKLVYCHTDAPFLISGYNIAGVTGSFTIDEGTGLTDNGDNTATIDPAALTPGTHVVTYTYYDQAIFEIEESFFIEEVGPVYFVDFGIDAMCRNDVPVELKGNIPTGNYTSGQGTFTGEGVTGTVGSGFFFNPGVTTQPESVIFYTFTSSNGCKQSVSTSVDIHSIPAAAFELSDDCVEPGDAVSFINKTTSEDAVATWWWDFGDPESGASNTSILENPTHTYSSFGSRLVTLVAGTVNSCYDTVAIDLAIHEKPRAAFKWTNDCFNDAVPNDFQNQTELQSTTYNSTWKVFSDGGSLLHTSTSDDLKYQFESDGSYDVELITQAANGCADTFLRKIILHPTMAVGEDPYLDDFENTQTLWYTPVGRQGSWVLSVPDGPVIDHAYSGTQVWVTNPTGNYSSNENSWITGPCFDLTGARRPMIGLQTWARIADPDDGVMVEYTTDGGNTWYMLGTSGDNRAVNWYNGTILGGDSDGWTGNTDLNWKESKHDLDPLVGEPSVRFRIRFVSDGASVGEGFALDDISIKERTRQVLLEHYTNMAEPLSVPANALVNDWAGRDTSGTALVHYHTSFPGTDELYDQYPSGPSARSVYYGISEVPYTRMDGIVGFSGFDGEEHYMLDTNLVVRRSLFDPQVDIGLNASVTEDGALTTDVELLTLDPLNAAHQYILHVMVLEREVAVNGNQYRNVLRKMLPDESGVLLNELVANGFVNISLEWSFDPEKIDPARVEILAVVQDDHTREVIQAKILRNTGVIEHIGNIKDGEPMAFVIYPNPAFYQVTIEFREVLEEDLTVEIFDAYGRLMENYGMQAGEMKLTWPINPYAKGMYFVRFVRNNTVLGFGKFVVRD